MFRPDPGIIPSRLNPGGSDDPARLARQGVLMAFNVLASHPLDHPGAQSRQPERGRG